VSAGGVSGDRDPRVLFIDHTGALGGGEISMIEIARAYHARGRVILFSDGPFRAKLEEAGIAVDVVQSGPALLNVRRENRFPPIRALINAGALTTSVARILHEYDVVYANSQKAFIIAAVAAVRARRPLIWHLHDILDGDHFSSTNIRVAVTLANRTADLVLCNSEATAEAFVAHGGNRSLVRLLYSGVVADPFLAASDTAARAARADWVSESDRVVGLFGRIAPWKGQHIALEAISRIAGVHLLLVGGSLFGEEAYEHRLRDLATDLGIADRVHFLGFRTDVPGLMRAVDVIVHTSVAAEPFGRVIVEGMLSERPVVATAAGGALEIVVDGVTGVLVPCGDPGALAGALRSLFADPRRREAMGKAGRERALAKFDARSMVHDVRRYVDEVAGR
jgi:glycosyltransferase involved in cell wall biosynthesis